MATRWAWPPDSRRPRSPTCGVVAVGQAVDELVRRRPARPPLDGGVVGVGPAEGDVVADGAVDEQRLLQHHGHLARAGWRG